jgi:hypothetical protein
MNELMKKVKSTWIIILVFSSAFIVIQNTTPTAKATTFFSEDFEPSPLPGWTSNGYWHLVNDTNDPCIGAPGHPNSSYSQNHSYGYHIDATCDYDDGAINGGYLMSPAIDLSGATLAYLHIKMWFQTQRGRGADTKWVQISADGIGWDILGEIADTWGDPMGTWFSKEYNISAYAGDPDIWILFFFDTMDIAMNHYSGWYIDDVVVDDSPSNPDILLVESWNRAPRNVEVAFAWVPMLQLNLSTNTNTITITSIKIDLSGPSQNPSDFSSVGLWYDFGNDIPEPLDDALLDSKPPPFPITFNIDLEVDPTHPAHLFIMFNIAPGATVGDWFGVSLSDNSYITVEDGDIVSSANLPIDTYVESELTQIIASNPDTLFVDHWNIAPNTVQLGDIYIPMLQLNLTTSENIVLVESISLSFSGSPYNPSNIDSVDLWYDKNHNGIFEPSEDTWLAGDISPPSTFSTTFYVTPEEPMVLYITYEISASANIGDWIGVYFPSSSSISVYGSDSASSADFPIDSYIPGVKTQIVSQVVDTLTVTNWQAKNPPTVEQGTQDVLIVNMTVDANANSVMIWSVKIDMKGTFAVVGDVSAVKIYHDVDNNGFLDTGADELLGQQQFREGSPPTTTVLFVSIREFTVTAGTPENMLLVYDFSLAANIGDFVGMRLADESYVSPRAASADVVSPINFPIETNPDTEIVASTQDALSVTHWQDKNPATALPGISSVLMANMTFETNNNSIAIASIDIDLKGSPTQSGDICSVEIYHDLDNNGLFDAQIDEILGFNAFHGISPSSATITLGVNGFTISKDISESLLIIYDISPLATPGDFVGISIIDETYINLHPWSMDTVSPTNFPIETSPDTLIIEPGGHITGHVVDKIANPVEGASATLLNSTGATINSAMTNETGWFVFNDITPAQNEYDIEITKVSHESTIVQSISVVIDATTDLGTITLVGKGRITGRVIDEAGIPISGAFVYLFNSNILEMGNTTTGTNGDFTFDDIEQGIDEYLIKAGKSNYLNSSVDDIDVDTGLTTDVGNITLQTNATITGRILNINGDSINNAKIELLDEEGVVAITVYSDSTGEYIFDGIGYEYITADIYSIDRDNLNLTIPDISLTVISEQPDDGDTGNWWWIILVVLIIIILVVVYIFIRMRGKKPEEPEFDS